MGWRSSGIRVSPGTGSSRSPNTHLTTKVTNLSPDNNWEPRVRELLDGLERPVELLVAHGPEETPLPGGRDVDYGAETERVVRELAALSQHVSFRVEQQPEGYERYPAVGVLPEGEDAGLRYYGLPWGYELGSLIGAVLEAGKRESSLQPESLEALAALDRDLAIDVFVTPT